MSFTQSLVILLALIAASSFFSMAEIALAASRRVRLRQMADDGDPRADTVLHVQEQPGYYFTAVQIGQNAVAILGGIVGEGSLTPYIADALYWIDNPVVVRHLSAALSFIAIISAFILLSDLLPKRIGMSQPEKFAVRLIRPMQACVALLKPIVWFYSRITDLVLRVSGMPAQRDDRVTPDDILSLAEAGAQSGLLARNEQRVIENVF